MKTISIYISILTLAVVALLPSCALKKNEFAQRKYYNFPRAKHTVEKMDTEYISVKSNSGTTTAPAPVQKSKTSEPIAIASSSEKGITLTKPELYTSSSPEKPAANRINKRDKPEKSVVSYKKSDVIKLVRKNSRNAPASNSADGMLILMILAAIFIPPLGVYLKENSTTQWFWITLAICIASIVIGYGIVPGLFGLWFVAAIIALLVVFDAI